VLSDAPWRCLAVFMLFSRRAVEHLYAVRRELAGRFARGELGCWPFCEAFIPTALKAVPDMRFAPVSWFATTEHLTYRPHLPIDDSRAEIPGSLAHPVVGREAFVATLLAEHPAQDVFRPGSVLQAALLRDAPTCRGLAPIRDAFVRDRDHAAIARLHALCRAHGWPGDAIARDLAFCRPACSSSISQWSRRPDPEEDAAGANGPDLCVDYAFHTEEEKEPWWMVDLSQTCAVEEVAILNCVTQPQRFRRFRIETAHERGAWITQHLQTESVDVSADPAAPWRLRFAQPVRARRVRVRLLGEGMLHLRRVQVLGQPASGSG
jgi:hypothetical protein